MAHRDFNDEQFSEDAPAIPDPGLDSRIKPFDFNAKPPADEGFKHNFEGVSAPTDLPGEPGSNKVAVTFHPNEFPRQKGHDTADDITLT